MEQQIIHSDNLSGLNCVFQFVILHDDSDFFQIIELDLSVKGKHEIEFENVDTTKTDVITITLSDSVFMRLVTGQISPYDGPWGNINGNVKKANLILLFLPKITKL